LPKTALSRKIEIVSKLNQIIAGMAMSCPLLVEGRDLIAPVVFPEDGGVVDVRNFGAFPDDGVDDTEAIQSALDAHPNGNRIIYLPSGDYQVSDTLRWPVGEDESKSQTRTILQGAEFFILRSAYQTVRQPFLAVTPGL
jgi:hypothetical protein